MTSDFPCRLCGAPVRESVLDLGHSPLANAFISSAEVSAPEVFYPLHVRLCGTCFLVQLDAQAPPEQIFSNYAYFSSFSESWLRHGKLFAEAMIAMLGLSPDSHVVEAASNDGYLLRHFVAARIPVLGIEPALNVAQAARAIGVPTECTFLGARSGAELAARHGTADLLIANNVLAHVPDLADFIAGLRALLAPEGVLSLEFPHLLQLLGHNQFDTIYHEHFSYFSLQTARAALERQQLRVAHVEELPTHGGSLRVFACHAASRRASQPSVDALLLAEQHAGLQSLAAYRNFASQAQRAKRQLLHFLVDRAEAGEIVAAYGAPAKGNTLLNYCGVRPDLLPFTVDRNPHKQGQLLPGTRIPILAPERIEQVRPDYLLILPWNLRDEIVQQLEHIRRWGGRFVVPIPALEVLA